MAFDTGGAASGAAAGSSLGPWGALAGGVLGGFMGGGKDNGAAKAAAEQRALEQKRYEQQDPFSAGGNRAQYVPQLNKLMEGGVGGLVNDSNYQAMQGAGIQAVQRQMAARGQSGSGQEMSAILKANFGIGMDYFNQQYKRLSALSGADAGRTGAGQGMDPGLAYQMEREGRADRMGSMGQGIGALSSIFGNSGGRGQMYNAGGAGSMSGNGSVQGNSAYVFDL